MESDRLAGTLMIAGAALALSVMGFSGFFVLFLVFLGFLPFSLIFLFGVYVARKRAEAPILAMATLWFATVGGLPFLWFLGLSIGFPWSAVLVGYLGLAGTTIAIVGAALKLTEQRVGARRPDPRWFERAAWLLGAGSLALLLAAAVGYPGLSTPGYVQLMWTTILVVVGLWLHLGAWIVLFAATKVDFREGGATPRLNRGRLAWTVSVLSFVAAIYLGTWYRPPFGQGPYPGPFLFSFGPLFPYHPAVFVPVVLCHALIFHRYGRFLPEGAPRGTVVIGVVALLAAAVSGLIGFFANSALANLPSAVSWWLFLPFPAGSTAIGYGLVFRGWQRGTHVEPNSPPSVSSTLSG